VNGFEEIVRLYEDACPVLTVLVEPHRVAEIRAAVEAAGLPARVTVQGSGLVPTGKLFVFNETALQRSLDDVARKPINLWGEL
jgi:hypothetical protein